MTIFGVIRCAFVFGVPLLGLFGCGDARLGELQAWIAEIKRLPPEPLEPPPQIKQIDNFVYDDTGRRDPFVMDERSAAEVAEARAASGIAPDPLRRKEPLEQYPLDALRMVGTLQWDPDAPTAAGRAEVGGLVLAPDGMLHRVRVGNYLGRNEGRITLIDERGIQLVEIVQDGTGNWSERQATLPLTQ